MDYDNDYYCEKCGYDIALDEENVEENDVDDYKVEGGFKTFLTKVASFVF